MSWKELADVPSTEQPTTAVDRKMESDKECLKCPSYKARIVNIENELKDREKTIECLKEDMNKLKTHLTQSEKVIWKLDHILFKYFYRSLGSDKLCSKIRALCL